MVVLEVDRAPQPIGRVDPVTGRLFSLLRDVREEVFRVQRIVVGAGSGAGEPIVADLTAVLGKEKDGIDRRLAEAADVIAQSYLVADRWSDSVIRVTNLWDDANTAWRAVRDGSATIDALLARLDEMIEEIGFITIPPRVAQTLDGFRVGGGLNFRQEFADELPGEAAIQRVLSRIHDHPLTVPGVVDVSTGTIIKADPRWWRRGLSWVGILLVMAVTITAAAWSSDWLHVLGVGKIPEGVGDDAYMRAVAFGYAGAVFHILVAAVKQVRSAGSGTSFVALGNFTIWVHIHEAYLMLYALAIPFAIYTLVLTTGEISLVTIFFVGYSIDSVLETLLARFDTTLKQNSQVIGQVLGGAAVTGRDG